MKLAVSGVELEPGEHPDGLIAAAQAAGASAVELWHDRNTSALGVERTVAEIEAAGLSFACVTSQIELYVPAGVDEAQRALIETIELAARVGAPFANAYFGYAPVRDDEAALAGYAAAVAPCVERAHQLGVTLLLENEFNAFDLDPAHSDMTREAERMRRIYDRVDHPAFGFTFDPANFAFAGVRDLLGAYETVRDAVRYVHVKSGRPIAADAPPLEGWSRYTDDADAYTTCGLEEGIVDWPAVLARLAEHGFDGYLVVEPHGAREELDDHCAQAAAYLRGHVTIEP